MDVEVLIFSMKLEDVVGICDMQIDGNAFVVECDKFWDDKQTRPVYQHTGRHKQIILRSLEDPLWPGIVQRLAVLLNDMDISEQTKLFFIFACHHGKHKSVSVAEAVSIILRGMGYKCSMMHTQLIRGCRCHECTWPQPMRDERIKGVAIRSWKNNAPP